MHVTIVSGRRRILSPTGMRTLARFARSGALSGAATGLGAALFTAIDAGYDCATLLREGLSRAGAGALLGSVGALAASATGIGVAALVGRGLLSMALSATAGMVASAVVQRPAERFARGAADALFGGRRAGQPSPAAARGRPSEAGATRR